MPALKCILQSRQFVKATIVDLRYRMKDVLGAIDRGETVIVLHRGKEKAKLIPIASSSGALVEGSAMTKDQPLFGMWSNREDLVDPASYLRKLRQGRQVAAHPAQKNRSKRQKPK